MKAIFGTRLRGRGAFTLVELMMGTAVSTIIGIGVFSMLFTSTSLSVRNLSVNLTSNNLRSAMARVTADLSRANTVPSLIDSAGAGLAPTASGAGVKFDYFVGAPYVITDSSGVPLASLPIGTTTVYLVRSTDPLASPDLPQVKDVLQIGGTANTLRPVITAVAAGAKASGKQMITVTVTSFDTDATGGTMLTAAILRPSAYLVVTVGTDYELRFYSPYSGNPGSDPYRLITNVIATETNETTPVPFSLTCSTDGPVTDNDGPFFVHLALSVRASNFDNWLKGKQADSINSFAHIETTIHPRVNP